MKPKSYGPSISFDVSYSTKNQSHLLINDIERRTISNQYLASHKQKQNTNRYQDALMDSIGESQQKPNLMKTN